MKLGSSAGAERCRHPYLLHSCSIVTLLYHTTIARTNCCTNCGNRVFRVLERRPGAGQAGLQGRRLTAPAPPQALRHRRPAAAAPPLSRRRPWAAPCACRGEEECVGAVASLQVSVGWLCTAAPAPQPTPAPTCPRCRATGRRRPRCVCHQGNRCSGLPRPRPGPAPRTAALQGGKGREGRASLGHAGRWRQPAPAKRCESRRVPVLTRAPVTAPWLAAVCTSLSGAQAMLPATNSPWMALTLPLT